MSTIAINSTADATTFVDNSGVAEWEWDGNASAQGFAAWLYRNRDEIDGENYEPELVEYLEYVGENPADYDLA